MGDVDDADASLQKAANMAEQLVPLSGTERGCWLVEKDDLELALKRAGDLDQLQLRDAQVARQHSSIDRASYCFQRHIRAPAQLAPVDEAECARYRSLADGQIAQDEIGSHVEMRDDRQLLVDDVDAGAPRIVRRMKLPRLVVEAELALVGREHAGQYIDQRALAGSVLPDEGVYLAG